MPVLVLDENGSPAAGVSVEADATQFPGIYQIGTTDASGLVTFINVALTSIGFTARTADKKIGVNGLAATTATTILNLLTFGPASNVTDFAVSNGTTGWTGVVFNVQLAITKRDTVLVVATRGQYDLQTGKANPKIYPFTKNVYIKFKFQTEEVPDGYFGTQFNDYFIVTI